VPIAGADPDERITTAATLAVLVGVICIVAGMARFGAFTDLISKPVRVGYLAGIALTVIATQLSRLLGFSGGGSNMVGALRELVSGLDQANELALAIGAGTIAVIVVVRAVSPHAPAVLIAVVGATLVVAVFDLADRGVDVVGALPAGLPALSLPSLEAGDLGPLLLAAVGISVVAFADTSVLSRSYASRLGDRVDQNRELVALGAANAAAGLFQGFPLSSSSSRTPAAEAAGARTQLTGVVGAVAIAVILVALPGITRDLPISALAGVVIVAVISLIDLTWFRLAWRVRRSEFGLALAAVVGVGAAGVLWGVGIAVGLSLVVFVHRAWRPHDAVLGRVRGLKGYHDTIRHPDARLVPGLLLFRFDAPLFFANADVFRERVLDLVAAADAPVQRVLVAAEPITDVDTTAAEMLEELHGELSGMGIELAFAEMKGPVKDRLDRYGLLDPIGRDRFHPTIGVGVHKFVDETGVRWVDWEDESESERQKPSCGRAGSEDRSTSDPS
jgi:MFS superfamily sulfate permease-like transporter